MSVVLVVAPHPDDETLGCGGTLLRHQSMGDDIHWLIMTAFSEQGGGGRKRVQARRDEIEAVAKRYGFVSHYQAGFDTTKLDSVNKSELIDVVADNFKRVKPDTVYLPFRNDVHSDHAAVFDAVAPCTKSFRYPSVKRVRAYETLSETEFSIQPNDAGFKPNLWVDISDYLDSKVEIMHMYQGEMGAHPFPRSEENIRALAIYRGAASGLHAAEAFISLKEII